MKFVSIDIETTGLVPAKHQILEVGIVIGETHAEVDHFPAKRFLKRWEHIEGHPFALAMNAELIAEIARSKPDLNQGIFDDWDDMFELMCSWLQEHGFPRRSDGRIAFVAAGKNFNGFDRQFLERIPAWNDRFVANHRALDPTSLYLRPDDDKPPDLATCCKRAGIESTVAHRGVLDALMVVQCLRKFYANLR